MKKRLILIFLVLLLLGLIVFIALRFEPVVRQKYFKRMTVREFLHDEGKEQWNKLYLNKDGNVEYKGMVIILDNNHKPLNEETAYWDNELILLFRAEGARPEEHGCDPNDIVNNGTLGCYLDFPD